MVEHEKALARIVAPDDPRSYDGRTARTVLKEFEAAGKMMAHGEGRFFRVLKSKPQRTKRKA
jgi:hypothetical protein